MLHLFRFFTHIQKCLKFVAILSCCLLVSCSHPSGLPVCDSGDIRSESVAFWNGSTWEAMGIGLFGFVDDVAVNSARSTVFCGGTFSIPGTLPGRNLAQWNDSIREWISVAGGTDGRVFSLLFYDEKLYVGGTFSKCYDTLGREVAEGPLVIWNGEHWETVINSECLEVYDMLAYENRIFMFCYNQCERQSLLYELNLTSHAVTVLGQTSQSISCMEIVDDWLYVGGNFAQFENTGTPLAARWNVNSRQWEGVNGFSSVTGYVRGIQSFVRLPASPYLFVYGEFSLVNGCSDCSDAPAQIDINSKSVTKLNSNIVNLHSFVPNVSGGIGLGSHSNGHWGVFEYFQYPPVWVYVGGFCTSDEIYRNTVVTALAPFKNGVVVVGKFDYVVFP